MRSVLIPVVSLAVSLAQDTADDPSESELELNQLCFDFTASQNSEQQGAETVLLTSQIQDEVQYSELPGVSVLGIDGKLRPLYHGPDYSAW